jgi:hypothetical protein
MCLYWWAAAKRDAAFGLATPMGASGYDLTINQTTGWPVVREGAVPTAIDEHSRLDGGD